LILIKISNYSIDKLEYIDYNNEYQEEIMQKLFNQCPACGGQLLITECQCTKCRLQMRGNFQPRPLASLSDDELTFIRVFLSARGNLSEVERVLGISYPTIRNKLDEINNILNRAGGVTELRQGKSSDASVTSLATEEKSRKDILQKVADGQLSPSEAIERLREAQEESK
jgi:hypothetical protein